MTATEARDDTLLTPAEAAAVLRVHRDNVYLMFRRGELAGVKVGRCVRIFKDSVQAILDAGRRRVAK